MLDLSLPLLYYDTHRNKFFYRKVELTHNNPLICDYGYEVVALGTCMTSGKPVLKSIINIERPDRPFKVSMECIHIDDPKKEEEAIQMFKDQNPHFILKVPYLITELHLN